MSTANDIKHFTFYRLSSVCTNMTYIGSTTGMTDRLRNHRNKSFRDCNPCSSRRLFAAGAVDSAEIGHAECTLAAAERMERGLILDERARTDVECVNVRLPGQTAEERKAEQVAHYALHKADKAKYARDNRARRQARQNARRATVATVRDYCAIDLSFFV